MVDRAGTVGIIVVHGVNDVEPGANSRALARNVRTVLRFDGIASSPVATVPFEGAHAHEIRRRAGSSQVTRMISRLI